MMTQEKIARINALAKKAKTPEGLTPEERLEQADLRREYLDAVKANLTAQLENTYIQEARRNPEKLEKRQRLTPPH